MPLLGTYQAILFDLDGTLLATLQDLADSMNAVLIELGHRPHPVEAYRYFVGEGRVTMVRRALPDQADERLVIRCVEAVTAEYARRWDRTTRPYDGIPELLTTLSRREIPMAVLSNKPHEFVELCVSRLLGPWSFRVVQGVADGVPHKPDPTGALSVASRMGASPQRVLYVGDTGTDMQTAVAAGMYPAGALWGFRTGEELTENGAEVLLERPAGLLELL